MTICDCAYLASVCTLVVSNMFSLNCVCWLAFVSLPLKLNLQIYFSLNFPAFWLRHYKIPQHTEMVQKNEQM